MPPEPGLLASAPLTVVGRIMPASNHTFLCELDGSGNDGGPAQRAVYKPTSGERPLWDFTDGTLAHREYAAWVVSDWLGWDVVPPTVLRDGPAGPGMVQCWMDADAGQDPVDVVRQGRVPPGYLTVLDAWDAEERPVTLVHEDSPALRRMAVFDIVVNNTDRKGGHVLPMADGHRYGVDHGVCFHTDDKLRTVLWGWAGQALTAEEIDGVARVRDGIAGALGERLTELLTEAEVATTAARCERLLTAGRLPAQAPGWPAIPWPPF